MKTQGTNRSASRSVSRQESLTLLRLEDIISTAETWQSEAAKALCEVRDRRLYRHVSPTFDAYVKARWGWERSRGYQMCQFGDLLNRLSTKVDSPPVREAHARPLYALSADDQIAAWRRVLADSESPTTAKVEAVAALFRRPLSRSHRGAIPYCGSKASVVPQILSCLPDHNLYVETHAGSAALLLAKTPTHIEVLNDTDDALVCFFRVLRDSRSKLIGRLKMTPFALTEWRTCRASLRSQQVNDIERARSFYVSVCQSFAGFGEKFNRSTHKPHAAYWQSRIDQLDEVAERLKAVVIENLDAQDCVAKYDKKETLFFVDPPYMPSARSTVGPRYRHDMSDGEHERLLDTLRQVHGKVLLCGAESALYDRVLRNWRIAGRFRLPCGTGGSKIGRYATTYRSEVLWANF